MVYNLFNHNQLLFLHIPKTAGTSVSSWLTKFSLLCPFEDNSYEHLHFDLETLKKQITKPYKSFNVVRNPWDRTISAYFYSLKHFSDFLSNSSTYITFEEFVLKLRDGLSISNPNLCQTQVDWISSPVDYILKFENLDQDFTIIQNYIGKYEPLPRENTRDQDTKMPYQEYYNNTTRKIIEEICARDILEFGYKFND